MGATTAVFPGAASRFDSGRICVNTGLLLAGSKTPRFPRRSRWLSFCAGLKVLGIDLLERRCRNIILGQELQHGLERCNRGFIGHKAIRLASCKTEAVQKRDDIRNRTVELLDRLTQLRGRHPIHVQLSIPLNKWQGDAQPPDRPWANRNGHFPYSVGLERRIQIGEWESAIPVAVKE